MKMRRMISVLLLICMIATLLPMGAVKARAEVVTNEYGEITFTTFEDLKKLCAGSYTPEETGYAFYEGQGDLVIKEDLTIPSNLQVYLWNNAVRVPKGVTLNTQREAFLSTSKLVVEGTVNASWMRITDELILTGKMSVNENITLGEAVSKDAAKKIILPNRDAVVSWDVYFGSTAELKSIVKDAGAADDRWRYIINMKDRDVTLNESVTIPANCTMSLWNYDEKDLFLVVSKGCTLELNGTMDTAIHVIVEGTLCNNSYIGITNMSDLYSNGKITIGSAGKYTGNGGIMVISDTVSAPSDVLVGVDLSGLKATDYGDGAYHYWELLPVSGEDPGEVGGFQLRVAGNTRYATSIEAANLLKEIMGVDKFENIIVSSGEDFADALAGSYLASVKGAPILLVKDSTVKMVKEYIQQNLVSGGTVYLLGGKAAVPEKMETGLDGFNVKRLGGNTRYETNLLILREAGVAGKDVIVCTGKDFADSLSASAVGLPILLVKDGLTTAQKEFLNEFPSNYHIIGGENAVSKSVEKQLQNFGQTMRLAGATRYKTSVLVAEYFTGSREFAVLAYGDNFPDGLAGGPLANMLGAPLLLTKPGREADAAEFIKSRGIPSGLIMGGDAVLPEKTVNKVFGIG